VVGWGFLAFNSQVLVDERTEVLAWKDWVGQFLLVNCGGLPVDPKGRRDAGAPETARAANKPKALRVWIYPAIQSPEQRNARCWKMNDDKEANETVVKQNWSRLDR